MTIVVVANSAKRDISDVIDYLERQAGPIVAEKYAGRFLAVFNALAVFPETCGLRPQLGALIRMAVIAPYTMIYEYEPTIDVVTILRVVHGRTNITSDVLSTS